MGMILISSSGGIPSTSYANSGGTGDRTASITVTASQAANGGAISLLVNGDTTAGCWFSSPGTNLWIRFDFGAARYISEITAKMANGEPVLGGNHKYQGSNDGSSWDDLSANFDFDATTKIITVTPLLETGYRYYRQYANGDVSSQRVLGEYEFKID